MRRLLLASLVLGSGAVLVMLGTSVWIPGRIDASLEAWSQILIVPLFQLFVIAPFVRRPPARLWDGAELKRVRRHPLPALLLAVDLLLFILALSGRGGWDPALRRSPAALYFAAKIALLAAWIGRRWWRQGPGLQSRTSAPLLLALVWLGLDRVWDLGTGSKWILPWLLCAGLGTVLLDPRTRESRFWLGWAHLCLAPAGFLLGTMVLGSGSAAEVWKVIAFNLLNLHSTLVWTGLRRNWRSPSQP